MPEDEIGGQDPDRCGVAPVIHHAAEKIPIPHGVVEIFDIAFELLPPFWGEARTHLGQLVGQFESRSHLAVTQVAQVDTGEPVRRKVGVVVDVRG